MRFIVDFYRTAIFVGLALLIAAFAFVILSLASSPELADETTITVAIVGTGALVMIGVSLGLVATFISIHDRHVELVDEVRLLREQFERRSDS